MPTGATYNPTAPPGVADFRARHPEFAETDDAAVAAALALALELYTGKVAAILYLAAHLLAIAAQETGAADGGAGVVTAEGIGGRRATYMAQGMRGGDAFFEQTAYGRVYLALRAADPGWAIYAAIGE